MDTIADGERATRNETGRDARFHKRAEPMSDDAAYVPWHYSSGFEGHHPNVNGFVHFTDSIVRYEEPNWER